MILLLIQHTILRCHPCVSYHSIIIVMICEYCNSRIGHSSPLSFEAHEKTCSASRQHLLRMSSSTSSSSASARLVRQSAGTSDSNSCTKKRKGNEVAQPSVVAVDFNIQTAPSNHSSISFLPKATNTSSISVNINCPSLRVIRNRGITVLKNRVLLEKMNAQLAETPTVSTSTPPVSSTTTIIFYRGNVADPYADGKQLYQYGGVNQHMDARPISDSNSAGHNSANELDYNDANEEDEEEVLQVLQDDESSPKNRVLLDYLSKVNKDFNNLFSMQERAVLDLINIQNI